MQIAENMANKINTFSECATSRSISNSLVVGGGGALGVQIRRNVMNHALQALVDVGHPLDNLIKLLQKSWGPYFRRMESQDPHSSHVHVIGDITLFRALPLPFLKWRQKLSQYIYIYSSSFAWCHVLKRLPHWKSRNMSI